MGEKKYQVFISSTYSDLKEERRKILDILLMADCIPAGMEAFVATDDEQFEVIKRVIDLCDYYVLIIGKRYGSVNPQTALSYTEMEYQYAKEQGIPVLVFAIDESVNLPEEKTEQNVDSIDKLKTFREKAMKNTLASIWKDSEDLTKHLAVSIMKAKHEIKRPGWQRAVDYDEVSLRREIMELSEEKVALLKQLDNTRNEILAYTANEDLAFENNEIIIDYYYYWGDSRNRTKKTSSVKLDLPKIFMIIATEMLDVSITELKISSTIEKYIRDTSIHFIDDQIIKKLINQFKSLGLIKSHWSDDKKLLYWGLTSKGKKVRDDMILIRNNK